MKTERTEARASVFIQGIPMAFNAELAERVRRSLARRKNIEEKRMFAGIGFLLNGNLLVGVRNDSLLVRLGPEQGEEALREAHVSAFNITGRGPMKGWIVVDLEGLKSDDELKGWIQRAVKFVATLPEKEK
jgi:TfoX/Sxy family transcriptional regulator of competence genes